MKTDVLVIGAGPAGMCAALEADRFGAEVILIDESFSLCGQLNQQTQYLDNLPAPYKKQRGTELAAILEEQVATSNITVLLTHTMIGAYADGNVGVTNGENTFKIQAKKVILTTGAAEAAAVFPGWTRPGIITVGAAQILLNREHVLPGKNAIVLGTSCFALEVAQQLRACGVNVKGIISHENTLRCKDEEIIASLEKAKIPIFVKSTITATAGRDAVEKITVDHDGVEEDYHVDLVCIGKGVSPILEPFEILDCQLGYKKELGGWVPQYYETFETSVPSVYVAGNAAGITSMGAIMLTGKIAGLSALISLGKTNIDTAAEKKELLWKELGQIEKAQPDAIFDARYSFIQDFHKEMNVCIPESILKRC